MVRLRKLDCLYMCLLQANEAIIAVYTARAENQPTSECFTHAMHLSNASSNFNNVMNGIVL